VATFVSLLNLSLTVSQMRHVERVVDLLIVAPRRKTLAQLAELELDGVDASNLADFFRISPWDAEEFRLRMIEWIFRFLKVNVSDPKQPIYLTIDDSLAPKDKGTRKLEGVDWHFDHNRHRTVKGGNHVVLRIHWGKYHYPLVWRLYLRQSTVRRLNRRRKKTKLRYQSKLELAKQMLEQIASFISPDSSVYVLFDSWYTSAKLVNWIRRRNWHVIAALKSNRLFLGKKLTAWNNELKGRSYCQVSLELANGKKRSYWVRALTGRLKGIVGEVRVIISKTGPGAKTPKFFLCTDTKLTEREILRRYQFRWSQEVDYWHVKLQLGLGDFRMQSYEAIERWYAVVYLTLTFLYWAGYQNRDEHGGTTNLSEVIQRIRHDHQREVLEAVWKEGANGTPLKEVVERFSLGDYKNSA
jgi:hypothetical protein